MIVHDTTEEWAEGSRVRKIEKISCHKARDQWIGVVELANHVCEWEL